MNLPGAGQRVARAEVGHALQFETDERVRYFVEENPVLTRPDDTEITIDLPAPASGVDIAAELVGATIELSTCPADGSLVVLFDTGAVLSVPPSPDFESWDVSAPGERARRLGPLAGRSQRGTGRTSPEVTIPETSITARRHAHGDTSAA
ncbi:DUF6188 family protein [Rhodococcus erythropolis]|uniref:DUF6188 family protein n=1 Tax=Rhodococcus erythropolis TaxID=1833 RepID=UPI0002E673C4|nr:DUF6188 family protein [Rhodococcus erythropolis]